MCDHAYLLPRPFSQETNFCTLFHPLICEAPFILISGLSWDFHFAFEAVEIEQACTGFLQVKWRSDSEVCPHKLKLVMI